MDGRELLTEHDMESLIMSIPEIRYRSSLASQWYRVKERLAQMEARYQRLCAGLPEPKAEPEVPRAEKVDSGDGEKVIIDWLYALAGDSQTVRAIHTRKLAQRIEKGEHKTGKPTDGE
jgi:hypothetical protein